MKAQITLIRAVGSEFLARKFKTVATIVIISATLLLVLAAWLPTVDPWLWLIAAPIMLLVIAGIVAVFVLRLFIQIFRPTLTDQQKTGITDFVDKLERVTESLQTPMPIIVYRVVRDTLSPGNKTFIQTAAADSTTLHKDLLELGRSFK